VKTIGWYILLLVIAFGVIAGVKWLIGDQPFERSSFLVAAGTTFGLAMSAYLRHRSKKRFRKSKFQ